MKVYIIENCDECDELKSWLQKNKKEISVVELKKLEEKYFEPIDDGLVPVPINAFPALAVGAENTSFIMGKEGCQNYIEKGFYHEIRTCPFLNKNCLETKC